MEKEVKIWYDQEGDFLEILFEKKEGYFRETENDAIMEKIDSEGNTIPPAPTYWLYNYRGFTSRDVCAIGGIHF